jgi:hypothetical protein
MKNLRLIPLLAPALLAGCLWQSEEPSSGTIDGMTVNNNESSLSARLSSRDQEVPVQGAAAKTAAPEKTLTLTLVAEIAPPVVNGIALEATSVVMKANFAFVSYASPGDDRLGAIESIHLKAGKNAVLRSQVLFDDADISGIFHDKDIYLAETSSDSAFPSSALLERVVEHGGKFVLRPRERVALDGSGATSVAVSGDRVFVTTADSGGVHVLSLSGLTHLDHVGAPGARWVDADGSRVAVVRGSGRLELYSFGLSLQNDWLFYQPDSSRSKNTVRLLGDKALIAAGSGGVRVVNVSTGKTLGIAPVPASAGAWGARAADARGDLIYAAYGPSGVYVYRASSSLDSATGDADVSLTLMGRLVLDGVASANHVAFDGNTLVVASGSGGVKIISVRWR